MKECRYCKQNFEPARDNQEYCNFTHYLADHTTRSQSKFIATSCWNWQDTDKEMVIREERIPILEALSDTGFYHMTCRNPYCINPDHQEDFNTELELLLRKEESYLLDMIVQLEGNRVHDYSKKENLGLEWKPKI